MGSLQDQERRTDQWKASPVLKKAGHRPMLVSSTVYARPPASKLKIVRTSSPPNSTEGKADRRKTRTRTPSSLAKEEAKREDANVGCDIAIVDTAWPANQIDADLMQEWPSSKKSLSPSEILFAPTPHDRPGRRQLRQSLQRFA